MAGVPTDAIDTSPAARRMQIERWARATVPEKVAVVEALCRDARALAIAGIRNRHPDASPREVLLRLGALTIERQLMIDAFRWDPEREGY